MRRPRAARTAFGIQLFPFLAVLICAMGALIVLLVLVVQQARVNADTIRAERARQEPARAAADKRLRQEQEDVDWQRQVLEQQREELARKLAERRLALSHLEDHIRRLEKRLTELASETQELERGGRDQHQDESATQQELARLRVEIDRERQQLEAAKQQATTRPRSFTIIPYAGPNGTRRRPIYIECRESGIVLQPEGIVLKPDDLAGPLGPGNPLDAALRAIREHWARVEGDKAGEPYPLLIVRPDGTVAYAMARAAMAAWDNEFGYELVEGDAELQFPPSDPALRAMLPTAIATARQRQALLAAAMPARFGRETAERVAMPDNYAPAITRPASGNGVGDRPGGSRPSAGTLASANTGDHTTPPTAARTPAPSASPAASPADAQCRPASATAKSGTAQPGTTSGGQQAGGAAPECMASTKGANWALRGVRSNTVGITRPITVDLYTNRIVIRPDPGDVSKPHVTQFHEPMRSAVEDFVAAVWTHIEHWGIAVAGGYWKPVLRVRIEPGAEPRFHELESLLRDSGLVIERRD